MALCTKIYWTTFQLYLKLWYSPSMMIMIIWCFTITQVVVSVSLIARGSEDFCLMFLEVSFPGCLGGLVVWRRRSGFPPHDQPRRQQLIIWGRHVAYIAFPRVFPPQLLPSESKWRQVRIASVGGSRRTEIQVEIPGTYEHMGRMCCRENKAKASTAMNCHNLESNS